jgi:hypothetical protein
MFRPVRSRLLAALAAAALSGALVATAASPAARAATRHASHRHGHPRVKLDRLEFPDDVPQAAHFKHLLVRLLKHEAWRADWGWGRGSTIEYRFFVKELTLDESDGVLRVSCSAVGRLPGGRIAKSRISFGGSPKKRTALITRVLQIVSRGVITRLAEMERVRRGDLRRRRVRAPATG